MALPSWKWILPAIVVVGIALLMQDVRDEAETGKPVKQSTSQNTHMDGTTTTGKPTTTTTTGSGSVFVIGDLHGDVHCARHWVERTGVIDRLTGKWVDPSSHLVFVGDYVDKGPTAKQTLEFVKALTEDYPNHVTALMGNHEMELLLDRDERRHEVWGGAAYYQLAFSSVHPGEYRNYLPSAKEPAEGGDSNELVIEALYNASIEVYSHRLHREILISSSEAVHEKSILNFVPDHLQSLVKERIVHFQKHYVDSFRSNTSLGAWLEARPVLALVHGTLFVHGGISAAGAQQIAALGVTGVNQQLAQHAQEDKLLDFIQETPEGRVVYNMLTFRGNHQDGACPYLPRLLPPQAVRLGVGHTPDDDVRILCNQQFLAIDSSLSRWFRNSYNEYCPGDKVQVAANGKYGCDKMNEQCQGQIVHIDANQEIQILS